MIHSNAMPIKTVGRTPANSRHVHAVQIRVQAGSATVAITQSLEALNNLQARVINQRVHFEVSRWPNQKAMIVAKIAWTSGVHKTPYWSAVIQSLKTATWSITNSPKNA